MRGSNQKAIAQEEVMFTEEKGMGEDYPSEVKVDGVVVATLKVGESKSVLLSLGEHTYENAYAEASSGAKRPNAQALKGKFLLKDEKKKTAFSYKVSGFFAMKFMSVSLEEK